VNDEPEGLECKPELLLQAFALVGEYVTKGRSHKATMEARMELALCLVDWSIMECDRGVPMLKLTAQMAVTRPPDGGNRFIGFP
jgi:hypothetical protein